jgi:malic enzyme
VMVLVGETQVVLRVIVAGSAAETTKKNKVRVRICVHHDDK